MPEVRDLLMTAVSVGRIVSRHSNRRRNRIEVAGFGGRFVQDFADIFFFFRDRHERQQRHATEGFA